ncbi:MAG: SPOR domain-containing protein [Prolixibacteraceae bacterium]|nr:SPOR domain-containing protein [Prolixibacteraceae bacterium]
MKKIVIAIVFVLSFAACKTTKQSAQSPYTTDPTTQPKVFSVPASSPETVTKEKAKVTDEKPIAIRKEQVTFTQQNDKVQNETNTFFVIIGSFSQLENAKNYRETLLNEGFTPIILHSETGYYRVCVNSFKNENDARTRVSQIRQAFPKYADIWLLIKE